MPAKRLSIDDPPIAVKETVLDPSTPPVAGRDYDPTVEEVGWVFNFDPLLGARTPIELSRSQIHTAITLLRAPALLLHFRTREISHDFAFLKHVDDIWHQETIFDLFVGKGLGEMKEFAGDHHLHLDEPEEIVPIISDSILHYWTNRAQTRLDHAQHQLTLRQQLVEREHRVNEMEAKMLREFRVATERKSPSSTPNETASRDRIFKAKL